MKKSAPKKSFTITVYTIKDAARKLGTTRQALQQAIKKGALEAEKGTITKTIVSTGWIITAEALKKYQISPSHQERGKKTK
jgi:hypothetical protein